MLKMALAMSHCIMSFSDLLSWLRICCHWMWLILVTLAAQDHALWQDPGTPHTNSAVITVLQKGFRFKYMTNCKAKIEEIYLQYASEVGVRLLSGLLYYQDHE